MTFVPARGLHALPGGVVGPSTRKLCRYPSADVRAISEILRRVEQREKAIPESAGTTTLAYVARERRRVARCGEKGLRGWRGSGRDDDETLRECMQAGSRVCIYTRAYFISTAGALLFPPERRRNPRARACERGGSRIIKDGLTIFPGVPGGRGQCDGALRGICRCTRCCVCFY